MIKEFLINNHDPVYWGLFTILFCVCAIIAIRARKLYSVSNYKGIKYFGNAFVFFAIAFFLRCMLDLVHYLEDSSRITLRQFTIIHPIVEYTFIFSLSLAGLYLVYSLVWKNLQGVDIGNMNLSTEFVLYLLAALITLGEEIIIPGVIYVAMILVFAYAIIVSYNNYKQARRKGKKGFHQLYFIVMVLGILGFLSNFLDFLISGFFPTFYIYNVLINLMIFGILLYGVFFVTKNG